MSLNRGDPLGFDMYVGPVATGGIDMLPGGDSCSGVQLVINGMVARSMADTLPMTDAPGGAVQFGRDVRGWVGSVAGTGTDNARAGELAIVYARDPRVDPGSLLVNLTSTQAGSQYAFQISVTARTTSGQPIAMILGVSALSVDILAQQGTTA